MPFSISAGVGFIALFGIAVLNGCEGFTHFWQGYRLIISTGRITVFLDEACNIAVRADASFSLR